MKTAIFILSILLATAIYMWASKPTEIINTGTERIEELKYQNAELEKYLADTLYSQETYFIERLRISDSVINAKRINNWNLIVRHEKELEIYKSMPTDSIYLYWVKESRTAGFD